MGILDKIFGDTNKKRVARYEPMVARINELEGKFESFSDGELKNKTQEFRERLQKGETLEDLLPEAFAAVRESAKRNLGQRHYDVQLMGGMVLNEGRIAEMKTGEGKTLSATLAAYLNALEGKGVHVVTVNDYLAKRDTNWMGPVFHSLGMTMGCIQHDQAFIFEPKKRDKDEVTVEMENLRQVSRPEAYRADITYGTNNEFGFDYLRDNMVAELSEMAQRGHHFAVVDEVDSILIDEARTPLIISAPDADSTKLYETFAKLMPHMKEEVDYTKDEKMKAVMITEAGIEKIENMLGIKNIYSEGSVKYVHNLEQALRAHVFFTRDKDYVVKDGEVIIVDEFTGRLMFGRRYSEGLHQAIEAKEGVPVQKESRTLATITFQNYFRMYSKLSGMTGTALTSAEEFAKVYKLEVVAVPTNKEMIRNDMPDSVYSTEHGKFIAVTREIKNRHKNGQPVLVGTVSIEKNELLSQFLKKEGIPHELLNAKNHEREAQIIAKAGHKGAVTVATNMAGRGVDIILGGRPDEFESKEDWQKSHDEVASFGGLHIIGTERHEARRIDDQLRGRAGRQGDPGSSQFYVSMEDDLMRIFASDKVKNMMTALKVPEDEAIQNNFISKAIESAQGKIEGFNFDTRKHVLEYDDVMNKQRETIYRKRREVLESENLHEEAVEAIEDELSRMADFHTSGQYREEWDLKGVAEATNALFELTPEEKKNILETKKPEELKEYVLGLAKKRYEDKERQMGEKQMREFEKMLYLRTIDMFWMEHLDEMEHLRDSVRLRAMGQKDPLVEYKNEGHRLFQGLLSIIKNNYVGLLFKAQIRPAGEEQQRESVKVRSNPTNKNIGRNDTCPCGSGKKYKKCCGKRE